MDDDGMTVVCLSEPASGAFEESVVTISGITSGCDFERRMRGDDVESCNTAFHRLCRQDERGYRTGLGPITGHSGILASGRAALFGFICLGR